MAYRCIGVSPLNLGEGTETFGEITSVARQLICGTTDTLSALRWLCIVLIQKKLLTIFIDLLLRELGMHEISFALHTFDPGVMSAMNPTPGEEVILVWYRHASQSIHGSVSDETKSASCFWDEVYLTVLRPQGCSPRSGSKVLAP